MIMYSAGSTNNRPYDSSAVHSCNTGYTIIGYTTRRCYTGGKWFGSPSTCQRKWYTECSFVECTYSRTEIICSDLPTLMVSYNGGSPDNRPMGTVATYICNHGYIFNGGSTRTCGSGGWSGSAPICQSEWNWHFIYCLCSSSTCSYVNSNIFVLTVSCGPPPSIDNGSPGQPTSTMIRGEVTYTCDTGFILIGSETITCLSIGNWGSSPSCQSKWHFVLLLPVTSLCFVVPTSGDISTACIVLGLRWPWGIHLLHFAFAVHFAVQLRFCSWLLQLAFTENCSCSSQLTFAVAQSQWSRDITIQYDFTALRT